MADVITLPLDVSQLETRTPSSGDSLLMLSADKTTMSRMLVQINSGTEPSLVYVLTTSPSDDTQDTMVPTVGSLRPFLQQSSSAVRVDTLQTLTPQQQQQGRTNIAAIGSSELSAAIEQHNISSSAHAGLFAPLATKTEVASKLGIQDAADTYATISDLDAVKVTAQAAVTQQQLTSAVYAHNTSSDAHDIKFNTLEGNLTALINQKLSVTDAASTYATIASLNAVKQTADSAIQPSSLQSALDAYVSKAGEETISGQKRFSLPILFGAGSTSLGVQDDGSLKTGAMDLSQLNMVADNTGERFSWWINGKYLSVQDRNSNLLLAISGDKIISSAPLQADGGLGVAGAASFSGPLLTTGNIDTGGDGSVWTIGNLTSSPSPSVNTLHRLRVATDSSGLAYFLRHERSINGAWIHAPIITANQWDFTYNSDASLLVKTPVSDTQAANKSYVDAQVSALAQRVIALETALQEKVNYQELTQEEFNLLPRPLSGNTLYRVTQS